MSFVLTVDIGTTSAKALILSAKGELKASAQEFYPTIYPQPGFAVQDPDVVVNGILTIIRKARQQFSGKLSAVGLSSAMHSLMAVDQKCQPLTPLILWSDMRSALQAKTLAATTLGDSIYRSTGTPIHPMSPLCKLMWIGEHEPALLRTAWKFISIKEYLLWKICGEMVIDYSVASSSGLFDIHHLDWSSMALDAAGIERSKLNPCVSPYERKLHASKEMSSWLGIEAETPIITGASDGCLAHLGSNAMGAGKLSVTIGTSGAVRMASSEVAHDTQRRVFNYRLDDKSFISGGATNNGTVLISWFADKFCDGNFKDLATFTNAAAPVDAGSNGLLFLPYVLGERAPHYNPDLRGVFFGLAQHHSRAHMMRSLLEGICLEVRSIVESVEETIAPATEVLASGGFVRSPVWIQMLADVLQKPIRLQDVNDASSLGAALMAFRAVGVPADFTNESDDRIFEPDPSKSDVYDNLYGIFTRTTTVLETEFEAIVRLQQLEG